MLPAFTWLIAHFFVSISRAEKVRTFGHTLRLVCQHLSSSRAGRANGVAGRRPRYALVAPRRVDLSASRSFASIRGEHRSVRVRPTAPTARAHCPDKVL